MGGKGGNDPQPMMQPERPDPVQPVDLSKRQQFIDAQNAAAMATAKKQQEVQNVKPADTTGDTAAKLLEPPQFLVGQSTTDLTKKKSKSAQTTTDAGAVGSV